VLAGKLLPWEKTMEGMEAGMGENGCGG